MILFILLAFLVATIEGKRLKGIFRERSLIPMLAVELLFWFLQICAWTGNFRYIRYAQQLQMMYILTLLWPILKFNLYKRAIIGSVLVGIGTVMNRAVMNANNGQMPVYPTLSKLTGYFSPGAIELAGDARHCMMSSVTKLKYLGDYIDVGFSIMSPGDILIHLFVTIILLGLINEFNRRGN